MYAITGITGKVGGEVARNLLAAKHQVRAVLRDAGKSAPWLARGCDVAVAEMTGAAALTKAFAGCEAVFVLLPPIFDPAPGFAETRAAIDALMSALTATMPSRVVCISTIGAQSTRPNLLSQLGMMEQAFANLPIPVAFLRPAWFMENSSWDIAPARDTGVMNSFLQPLDKAFPMIATADVGRVAAELLQQKWAGRRVVELEGPRRVTPNEIAETLGELLHRLVRAQAVPRSTWEPTFLAQGMKNPAPRVAMIDGFNEGWIDFEAGDAESQKGKVELRTVLEGLV
jgi:uncharacterized protein YbjT (DUF2867 family)